MHARVGTRFTVSTGYQYNTYTDTDEEANPILRTAENNTNVYNIIIYYIYVKMKRKKTFPLSHCVGI